MTPGLGWSGREAWPGQPLHVMPIHNLDSAPWGRVAEWICCVSLVSSKDSSEEGVFGPHSYPQPLPPEISPPAHSADHLLASPVRLFALGHVSRVSPWARDLIRAEVSLLGSLELEIPSLPGPSQPEMSLLHV